jgi:hypothetical protein
MRVLWLDGSDKNVNKIIKKGMRECGGIIEGLRFD